MSDDWIKPVFLVFGIIVIVIFAMLVPSNFQGLDWTTIRDELIVFLPFLVALGVGLSVLMLVKGRR